MSDHVIFFDRIITSKSHFKSKWLSFIWIFRKLDYDLHIWLELVDIINFVTITIENFKVDVFHFIIIVEFIIITYQKFIFLFTNVVRICKKYSWFSPFHQVVITFIIWVIRNCKRWDYRQISRCNSFCSCKRWERFIAWIIIKWENKNVIIDFFRINFYFDAVFFIYDFTIYNIYISSFVWSPRITTSTTKDHFCRIFSNWFKNFGCDSFLYFQIIYLFCFLFIVIFIKLFEVFFM